MDEMFNRAAECSCGKKTAVKYVRGPWHGDGCKMCNPFSPTQPKERSRDEIMGQFKPDLKEKKT